MISPVSRTLAKLKKDGWTTQIVERWCPHSMRRIDLFGIIDVLAVRPGYCLGVQVCAMSSRAAHLEKLRAAGGSRAWLAAGNQLEVWSWRKLLKKRGGKALKWEVEVDRVRLEDLDDS